MDLEPNIKRLKRNCGPKILNANVVESSMLFLHYPKICSCLMFYRLSTKWKFMDFYIKFEVKSKLWDYKDNQTFS